MKRMHLLAKTSLLLCTSLYIFSCKEMEPQNQVTSVSDVQTARTEPESAYPGEAGVLKKTTLFGKEITYSEIDGKAVYQGDIILSPEQLKAGANARMQAAGLVSKPELWPNNTVYFNIDASITNTDAIYAAIAEVEASTPVRFVARPGTTLPVSPIVRSSYVTFTRSRGYSSSIGRVGGQQFITVPVFHNKGGILHEIGHTLGLFHEHNRTDRDNTIKINYNNIAEAAQPNFANHWAQGYDGFDYGTMDLGSIMMLDSYAYSQNGQPSMTLKNGSTFSVQRTQLSQNDIAALTVMYSNVYALSPQNLFAGDIEKGKKAIHGNGFHTSESLCVTSSSIYITRLGTLYQANRISGKGNTLLTSVSGVKGMVYVKDRLYFIMNGYLHNLDPAKIQGTKAPGQYWLPATSLSHCNGFLFIVNGDQLFRVSMDGQAFVSVGSGYKGVTETASLKNNLYILKQGKLWKMDPNSGAIVLHSNTTFATNAQLAANTKNLLITSQNTLYTVDEAGAVKAISDNWPGITHLAAAGSEE